MNRHDTHNRSYKEPCESSLGSWLRAVALTAGFLIIQGLLEKLG